jgi:hypothetical protein
MVSVETCITAGMARQSLPLSRSYLALQRLTFTPIRRNGAGLGAGGALSPLVFVYVF